MKASECLNSIPLSAEYIGNDDVVLFNGFSLLQRGTKHEGINVPFFPKEKKKHFIKSINVNETNTVWTAKLHFPIISDTFTIDT